MATIDVWKLIWAVVLVAGVVYVRGQAVGIAAPAVPAAAQATVAAAAAPGGYGAIGFARPAAPLAAYSFYYPGTGYGYTVNNPVAVGGVAPIGLASPYGRR